MEKGNKDGDRKLGQGLRKIVARRLISCAFAAISIELGVGLAYFVWVLL
jgi:hypothetical protein